MENQVENISMMIITYSGTAKSCAMDAIEQAKKGDFENAKQLIDDANENQTLAAQEHFKALQMDIKGELKMNLLFVHSEDQMLNAETTISLAQEMIAIWNHIHDSK